MTAESVSIVNDRRVSKWYLLAPETDICRFLLEIRAKRVNVDPAAAGVVRAYREILGLAALLEINKHALNTSLVKVVVLAKRDDIRQ
jgi:hypothetical protein